MANGADNRTRTIAKAGLWTLLGLFSMVLTGFLVTGSVETGGQLALINTFIGFGSYVVYERIWASVRWGRRDD